MLKGYCSLCADILHIGHIRYIQKCRRACDYLIVGIMTDQCIERYKGQKPIMPYEQRAEIVLNIKGVDEVVPQDEFEFSWELKNQGYMIFDSSEHMRLGADMVIDRTPGLSSSQIKKRIHEDFNYRQRQI
jgi:cytidyltransferase-like protein